MYQADITKAYNSFVHEAVTLRNQGSISENTFRALVIGASSYMINQKLTNDFNSYMREKFDFHFRNSIRQAIHF